MDALVRHACLLLGLNRCALYRFDQWGQPTLVADTFPTVAGCPGALPEAEQDGRWWARLQALPRDAAASPLVIEVTGQSPPPGGAPNAGARAALIVPLRHLDTLIGMLVFAQPDPTNQFSPRDLALAASLGELATLALAERSSEDEGRARAAEQARIYHAEAERAERLDALLRLAEQLHSINDQESLLQHVVDAVTATLGFRVAVLNLRGEQPGTFIARAVSGVSGDEQQLLLGTPTGDWDRLIREEFRIGRCYLLPPEYVTSLGPIEASVVPDLPPAGVGAWDPHHFLFVPVGGEGLEAPALLCVDEPRDGKIPSRPTLVALERFAAQAALALEKAKLLDRMQRQAGELAGVISSMEDAVILGTPDMRVRALNQAAVRLTSPGGPLDPALAHTLRRADGTPFGIEQLPLELALQGLPVGPMEVLASDEQGGDLWLSVTGAPIVGAGGSVSAAVVVIRDVSEQRSLEQLRQSFVATVSHELRTPLSAILGYGELLRDRWKSLDDTRRRDMLGKILASSARLEHLVRDLLLLSQAEAGELRVAPEALDLAPLVEQALVEVHARFPEQQVRIRRPAYPLHAWADRNRTQQVISQLIDNAAKYAGEAGPIHIAWGEEAGQVGLRVVDSGPGIGPADLPRLFTRFGKLDHGKMRQGYVGTGLGLYICRQLVEAMGGAIWYEGTPGGGSTFTVRLPAAGQPDTEGTIPAPPAP